MIFSLKINKKTTITTTKHQKRKERAKKNFRYITNYYLTLLFNHDYVLLL
jgi:hypothetical protein